ncbi:hypothetical protein [Peristeroidobacter agariperforans]|uniref:hypothetical protein n=1 Tax=Peristeroidobacter agariperforans TaxID=268404 RepID=UPI001E572F9D|nr:hypothetical protein [Peristeroidobacter agariperforans]
MRIDFPGFSGQQSLERISSDEFFESFDANELAFLYQDEGRSQWPGIDSNRAHSHDSASAPLE